MQDKQHRMKTGEKILFGIFGLFLLFTAIGFMMLEHIRHTKETPMYPIANHYDFSKEGLRGSTIFREKSCTNCHRALRDGTNMGVVLDGLGSKYSFDYFYNFLKNPEKTYRAKTVDHGPPPKMAAYVSALPDSDLRAIAQFLSELRADQGAADSPIPPREKSAFIESILQSLAPSGWKKDFKDIRDGETDKGERRDPDH
jgi:cytochrome c553